LFSDTVNLYASMRVRENFPLVRTPQVKLELAYMQWAIVLAARQGLSAPRNQYVGPHIFYS
jgi:hypothetical protein